MNVLMSCRLLGFFDHCIPKRRCYWLKTADAAQSSYFELARLAIIVFWSSCGILVQHSCTTVLALHAFSCDGPIHLEHPLWKHVLLRNRELKKHFQLTLSRTLLDLPCLGTWESMGWFICEVFERYPVSGLVQCPYIHKELYHVSKGPA